MIFIGFILNDLCCEPLYLSFLEMSEEPFNIWGTWHSTLKSGSKDPGMTGEMPFLKLFALPLKTYFPSLFLAVV
jgi:hypothetical protein